MPDYHPLDVRYKGPSTAYRGSAHGKPKGQARAASQSRKKPETVQTPSNGPWSGKGTKAATSPAPRPPVPAATSSLMGQFFGVFRSVRNIYLVFIVIVVIAMAFGTPMSRMNSINFQSEQMVTMP